VNNELEMVWKETVVKKYGVLSYHLYHGGGLREIIEPSVMWARFEPETSYKKSANVGQAG
jgi:hypothetical protein